MSEETVPVDDPVAVLRTAVDSAVRAVLRLDPHHADARVEMARVLTAFGDAVEPVLDRLVALTDAAPHGPVAATLGFMRDAKAQAADGDVQAARVFLLAGRTALFRLARPVPDSGVAPG